MPKGVTPLSFCITVQRPRLASPIPSASLRTGEGEETFPRSESRTGFPRPWWEGLGEGANRYLFVIVHHAQSTKKKVKFLCVLLCWFRLVAVRLSVRLSSRRRLTTKPEPKHFGSIKGD